MSEPFTGRLAVKGVSEGERERRGKGGSGDVCANVFVLARASLVIEREV